MAPPLALALAAADALAELAEAEGMPAKNGTSHADSASAPGASCRRPFCTSDSTRQVLRRGRE